MKIYTETELEKAVEEAQVAAVHMTADGFRAEFGHLIWSNLHMTLFCLLSFALGTIVGAIITGG